jgi:taurine dioxygenase
LDNVAVPAADDRRDGVTGQTLKVEPLTERIGAVITGIDLTRPLSNFEIEQLHDAIATWQVIFFRDQKISHEQHETLGRYFGKLAIHSGVRGIDGHPEIVRIHADADSKMVAGECWHSDLSCDAEPPMGSILYLHTVPPLGGDTLFCSMYAAYDALSSRMKTYLEGLTAEHNGEIIYRPITKEPDRVFPISNHPVVRIHPVTRRKCLYLNSQYVTKINELSPRESRAILDYLFVHSEQERFQCRFRWEPHSIAFWDNRCALHQAIWDYYPKVRSGYRVTVAGDKPIAA